MWRQQPAAWNTPYFELAGVQPPLQRDQRLRDTFGAGNTSATRCSAAGRQGFGVCGHLERTKTSETGSSATNSTVPLQPAAALPPLPLPPPPLLRPLVSMEEQPIRLGKGGPEIASPLGMGLWSWGDSYTWGHGGYDATLTAATMQEAYQAALQGGCNLFDTAESCEGPELLCMSGAATVNRMPLLFSRPGVPVLCSSCRKLCLLRLIEHVSSANRLARCRRCPIPLGRVRALFGQLHASSRRGPSSWQRPPPRGGFQVHPSALAAV
jgi:hypothetical protein